MAGGGAHVWNDTHMLMSQMNIDMVAGSYTKYIGAAKLWSGTHQTLAQGTKVVIIELKQGIAYVDAFRRA